MSLKPWFYTKKFSSPAEFKEPRPNGGNPHKGRWITKRHSALISSATSSFTRPPTLYSYGDGAATEDSICRVGNLSKTQLRRPIDRTSPPDVSTRWVADFRYSFRRQPVRTPSTSSGQEAHRRKLPTLRPFGPSQPLRIKNEAERRIAQPRELTIFSYLTDYRNAV